MTAAPPCDRRRARPRRALRCALGARGGLRPGSELRSEARGPARFGVPPPSPGRRSRGSRCPRRAERETWPELSPHPPPPAPPPDPRGQDTGKLRLPGDGGSQPDSEPLPAGPRPPRPRGSSGQGSPSSKPSPGSQERATSAHPRGPEPLTLLPRPGDRADRGGGTAYLGQVRSGDNPGGGGRCSPAQQPGPEGGPKSPVLRPSLALKTVLLSDARKPPSCSHPAWGQRANRPNRPQSLGPGGLRVPAAPGAPLRFRPPSPAPSPGSLPRTLRLRRRKVGPQPAAAHLEAQGKPEEDQEAPHCRPFSIWASISHPALRTDIIHKRPRIDTKFLFYYRKFYRLRGAREVGSGPPDQPGWGRGGGSGSYKSERGSGYWASFPVF